MLLVVTDLFDVPPTWVPGVVQEHCDAHLMTAGGAGGYRGEKNLVDPPPLPIDGGTP